MKRVWVYEWEKWRSPEYFNWWYRFVPSLGGDEYERTTVVFPIPFVCHVVIALWNPCEFWPWLDHEWGQDYCERCGRDVHKSETFCAFHCRVESKGYMSCFECWHEFKDETELEADFEREMGYRKPASEIYFCPFCAHDL